METNQLVLIALLFVLGLSNGLMDSLTYHFTKESFFYRFKSNWFGNPSETWKNKYKNYPESTKGKYWGAKTFLSFTTDAWHFFKFLHLGAFKVIVTWLFPVTITGTIFDYGIVYIAVTLVISAGFHFTYSVLNKL